jgi:glycyl-tRNA synthetase beta chain
LPEVLVEVGCEELPSSACREILEQAPALAASALEALRLGADETRVWVAPRRFALHLSGVPERQEASSRSVRGPAEAAAFGSDGAPTKAAEGFARGQGVAVADLVVREDNGRRFVFAERAEDAQEVADLVPELTRRLLEGLRFSKTMRWGSGDGLRFSRPVRWLVAKVDERTVPFELHGLEAGEVSQGHRFLGGPAAVTSAGAYRDVLRGAAVVADHEERRAEIRRGLETAAAALDAGWSDPGGKLEEVVFLVERPSVITGRIDEAHLRLPSRVLVTAMQSHQRYFPVAGTRFAFVANGGDPAVVRAGNERVLEGRLEDASFTFERDVAIGIDGLAARLGAITFVAQVGSFAEKTTRLERLADALGGDEHARTAARLAKADQAAELVREFADLEGHIGAQYARLAGYPEPVCAAIEEQYLPDAAGGPLPATSAGRVLAAAEKLDNLAVAFALGNRPTGSRDPYGLRRAAIGLCRLAIEGGMAIDVHALGHTAHSLLVEQGAELERPDAGVALELAAFVLERLETLLDVPVEFVRAACGATAFGADIATIAALARELAGLPEERLARIQTVFTRADRIVAKSGFDDLAAPDESHFEDDAERALWDARGVAARELAAARSFEERFAALEALSPPLERYFDEVLVMAPDEGLQANRLRTLHDLRDLIRRHVGDLSQLPGQ